MNKQEFIESIKNSYETGLEIIKVKNADYANSENPFKNFESADIVGVNVDRAILVRILDKLSRVSNLLEKPAEVKNEAIEDTILDAINYLAILKAHLESTKKEEIIPF